MSRRRKHSRGRRRSSFRRNPGFSIKSIGSTAMRSLTAAAIGAAGIAGNQLLANQIAKYFKVSPNYTEAVKVGTALVALPLVARFAPPKYRSMIAQASTIAAAVAIFQAAKNYLPSGVQSLLAGNDYEGVVNYVPASIAGFGDSVVPAPLES